MQTTFRTRQNGNRPAIPSICAGGSNRPEDSRFDPRTTSEMVSSQAVLGVTQRPHEADTEEMSPFELLNHLNVARLALGEEGLEGTDLLTLVGIDAAAVVDGRSRDLHQTSITWFARAAQRLDVRAIITDSTERFEVVLGSTPIEVREEPSVTRQRVLRAMTPTPW